MTLIGQLDEEEKKRFEENAINMHSLQFTGKDLGLSYKQLNSWNTLGLFYEKQEPGKWRSFGFIESVWILLALELRKYGFSIEEIKKVKSEILDSDLLFIMNLYKSGVINELIAKTNIDVDGFSLSLKKEIDGGLLDTIEELQENPIMLSNLAGWVGYSIVKRDSFFIGFTKEGLIYYNLNYTLKDFKKIGFATKALDPADKLMAILNSSGVIISLDHLVARLILTEPQFEKNGKPTIAFLSKAEIQIMEQIRNTKGIKSVTVKYQNEKPSMIYHFSQVQIDPSSRVVQAMVKGGYETISITSDNGDIVYSTRETKTKIKN